MKPVREYKPCEYCDKNIPLLGKSIQSSERLIFIEKGVITLKDERYFEGFYNIDISGAYCDMFCFQKRIEQILDTID
jgi:hypothetical protein